MTAFSSFIVFNLVASLTYTHGAGPSASPPIKRTNKKCCETDAFPRCFVGSAKCCPDGTWVCPNGRDGTHTCPGSIRSKTKGLLGKPCDPVFCTDDVFLCPDGTFVPRDPDNNCAFLPCPPKDACTDDVFLCPDGTFVPRDPDNNCSFLPCPIVECAEDEMECPDGSIVGRDSSTSNCDFFPCPNEDNDGCPDDVTLCPDGSAVIRDPAKKCAFPPCPSVNVDVCTDDVFDCADGTSVRRDPTKNCRFFPCPEEGNDALAFQDPCPDCPERVFQDPCPDCPERNGPLPNNITIVVCTDDVLECPDGSFVPRSNTNNCQFLPCPQVGGI